MLRYVLLAIPALAGCVPGGSFWPDHHLAHPRQQPAAVVAWSDEVAAGELLIHILGARPPGIGRLPP